MAAKFHAINEDYIYKNFSDLLSSSQSNNYDALLDPLLNLSKSNAVYSIPNAHKRAVAKLCAPTFNYVLSQSGAQLLNKILRIPNDIWKGILSFNTLFDKTTGEYVARDDADSTHELLYGAQIAEHLINEFDIDAAIYESLYGGLQNICKTTRSSNSCFTVRYGAADGYIPFVAGYYVQFDPAKGADVIRGSYKGLTLSELIKIAKESTFDGPHSRLSYLLNTPKDKSALYGMLNYYIIIIPYDMRPKIDNQHHKLEERYRAVLEANYSLSLCLNTGDPSNIATYYRNLDIAVGELQYKRTLVTNRNIKPDDLALLERVKSKKGQIRMRNLGKRQDYSGRAVVCINPYLPLDVIRVPEYMLPKLLEYHALPFLAKKLRANIESMKSDNHKLSYLDNVSLEHLDTPDAQRALLEIIKEEKLCEKIPMLLGRQPTLHKQSLQAFHIEASPLHAIEMNPLVCPAFNMDFDGDQAHFEVPCSPEAVKEMNDISLTTQNLFLAKSGECTTVPRQDMLYGLYFCTRKYPITDIKLTVNSYDDARKLVIEHKLKVSDTIRINGDNNPITAGEAAFLSCFPKGLVRPSNSPDALDSQGNPVLKVTTITNKTITRYVDALLKQRPDGRFVYEIGTGYDTTETFVGCINAMVDLGFRVARLYPPNLSLVQKENVVPEYDKAIPNYYSKMQEIDLYYNLGFDTAENYSLDFNKHLDEMKKSTTSNLKKKLGENNGYVLLSDSGARGSLSNLDQAFGHKGCGMKNNNESFDALIENSYSSQLTPLEHCVDAYGGRQGQIDKSLKTGDTGYAMRRMWHVTQGLTITKEDCGTNDFIKYSKKDLITVVPVDSQDKMNSEVSDLFAHMVAGHYLAQDCTLSYSYKGKAGDRLPIELLEDLKKHSSNVPVRLSDDGKYYMLTGDINIKTQTICRAGTIIDDYTAKLMGSDDSVQSVAVRSPLTCKKPCCAKCYGIDWSTRRKVVVGTPIGITGAQSIGEPGTQITMKNFQKGGIAGQGGVTSVFDKVSAYVNMKDIAESSKSGKYSGYDPLAWETGETHCEMSSDVTKKKVYIGKRRSNSVEVPIDLEIKSYVHRGEGISYAHGDYDMHEVIKYCNFRFAQTYLVSKLYMLYASEVKIRSVHFETLVAQMTRYMIVDTDRSDLMIGQYCTAGELYRGSLDNTEFFPRIIGASSILCCSNDALDAIQMEKQVEGLSHICLLNATDTLTKPINRMLLGKSILDGSAVPTYVKERKEVIKKGEL